MKNMILSLLFVAGLVIQMLAVSQLVRPKNNSPDDGMLDPSANGILGEPENTVDLLILGDSESYSSFIPLKLWDQFGITAYCCGTPKQKLCYSELFLHKTLKTQSPKVVILETDAIFRKVHLEDIWFHRLEKIFPVFAYHSRWKSLKMADLRMSVQYTYKDESKGYHSNTKVSAASADGYMKKDDSFADIPERNRGYVKSMKAYCKDHGALLILVSTPSTVNWNMARHNSTHKLAEELGILYLDLNLMNEQVPIDWKKDTYDKGNHLNQSGAEKVTKCIGQYLSESRLLPNHKDDPAYIQT